MLETTLLAATAAMDSTPMRWILFLAARMRVTQNTQSEAEKYKKPQPWARTAMVCCAYAVLAQATKDPNSPTQKADRGALLGKVGLCTMLSPEAIHEPRQWRTPWRKFAHADAITCATKIRLALKTVEESILGQDDENSKEASNEAFDKMLAMESFGNKKSRDGGGGKLELLFYIAPVL